MTDTLDVFLHEDHLGEVTPYRRGSQREQHRVKFRWNTGYQPGPVTLTESFTAIPGVDPDPTLVSNFFGGYTPDGNQREAMAKRRGIDKGDLFALLREFGGSIGGALTFRKPDEMAPYVPHYTPVDEGTIAQRLKQAVQQHDLGIQDDSRSMLPGFQPKILFAKFDSQWHEPHGRAHSTHILKPQLKSRPEHIYNEFYSHQLSRAMGLTHFASTVTTIGHTTFLEIERYDRKVEGTKVTLVHQEDAAQASGLDWRDVEAKFQDPQWPTNPERPSLRSIAELTGSLPDAVRETTQWLRQLVFHVLIGNNDAHAKNVGLLHGSGRTRLSELYDAVPNLYQPGRINWDMAMSVDGKFDHRTISSERLAKEASSWLVLRSDTIENTIDSTIRDFNQALAAVTPPSGVSPELPGRLDWNAKRLAEGSEISAPKEKV